MRFAIDAPDHALPPIYCCHCRTCQASSGSAFREQAVVRADRFTITGDVIDERYTTPSGAETHHRLCATCYTRIYNSSPSRPGLVLVRAGALDRAPEIVPRAHIWVSRKQPWVVLPEGAPSWQEGAPFAELGAALFAASAA